MREIIKKFKALSKESRKNIIIMSIIGLLFIIGICLRWDYIKSEVSDTVNNYVERFTPADSTKVDSTKIDSL